MKWSQFGCTFCLDEGSKVGNVHLHLPHDERILAQKNMYMLQQVASKRSPVLGGQYSRGMGNTKTAGSIYLFKLSIWMKFFFKYEFRRSPRSIEKSENYWKLSELKHGYFIIAF